MCQNRPVHMAKLCAEWYIMRQINPDKILSELSAATTHKQLISVSENSTDVRSNLIIHMITYVEPLVTTLVKCIWMSVFVWSGVLSLFYAAFSCIILWYIIVNLRCNSCLSSYVVCS